MNPSIIDSIKKFVLDESGQATTEYILLLGFLAASVSLLSRAIMQGLDRGMGYVGGALEKQLRTGRLKFDAWTN